MRRNYRYLAAVSENLESVVPGLRGRFVCPICLMSFPLSAYDDGGITHGHIIPRAIRSGRYALICKACNSLCGAKQDRHLVEYAKLAWNIPVHANVPVRLKVGSEKLRASVRHPRPSKLALPTTIVIPKTRRRSAAKAVDDMFSGHPSSIQFGIAPIFDDALVRLAILTAAYLEAFCSLGYWYVLNSNLDPIRAAIRSHETSTGSRLVFRLAESIPDPTLIMVIEPSDLRSVSFRYQDFCALLPTADDRDLSLQRTLSAWRDYRGPIQLPENRAISGSIVPRKARYGPITLGRNDEVERLYAYPEFAVVRRLEDWDKEPIPWLHDTPQWVPGWATA